jgi:AraC-like DNA-binding protein
MASSFPNFLHIMRRALHAKGIALDPLLQAEGLGLYGQTRERLPVSVTTRLWSLAEKASGDPSLGLSLANYAEITDFEELGVVLIAVRSPLHALQRMARYNRIASDVVTLVPFETKDTFGVQFKLAAGAHWRSGEFAMAIVTRLLRGRFGAQVGPFRMEFAFPTPGAQEAYTKVFQCPMTFGTEVSSLTLHRDVLARVGEETEDLFAKFEPLLDARLSVIEAESTAWCDRVAQCLETRLREGEPSLDDVAKTLHVSSRTLQRNLASEGKSFQGLLDETRRALAIKWLAKRDLSLTQVAFLLGFSSSSAFSRAHKRWFGEAPSKAVEKQ